MTSTVITLCFSGIMMIIGVTTFIVNQVRTTHKDNEEEQKELASIRESLLKANMKLDTVCATTNETRTDIKAMDKRLNEHSEKIAIIGRDLETAFLRIDELKSSKEDRKYG